MSVSFSQLEAFVNVVKLKSFSLAADSLFLSQPTVSLKVKELEKHLGAKLVLRSTKSIRLTPLGEIIYPYAKRILSLQNRIFEEAQRAKDTLTGVLRVAVSSTPAHYLVPDVLVAVTKRYPGARFDVLQSDSQQVEDDVISGVAEVGIIGREIAHSSLVAHKLMADRMVLITPNTRAYAKLEAPVTAEMMRTMPFVGREGGSGTRTWTIGYLASLEMTEKDLKQVATFPSNETVIAAVKAGLGASIVSAIAVQQAVATKALIAHELTYEGSTRAFYLIHAAKRPLSPLAAQFVEALAEVAHR